MSRQSSALPGVFEEARLRLERQVAALNRSAIGDNDLSRAERASVAWRVLTLALFDVATDSEIGGLTAWRLAEGREGMDRLFARLAERGDERALDSFIAAVEGIEGRAPREAEALDRFLRDELSGLRAAALEAEHGLQAGWFFPEAGADESVERLRRGIEALWSEPDAVVSAFLEALGRAASLGAFRLQAIGHARALARPLGAILDAPGTQRTDSLRAESLTIARAALIDYAADRGRQRALEALARAAEVMRLARAVAGLIEADHHPRLARELLSAAPGMLNEKSEGRRRARAARRAVEAILDRLELRADPSALGEGRRQGWIRLHAQMSDADMRSLETSLRISAGDGALNSPAVTTALAAARRRATSTRRLIAAHALAPRLEAEGAPGARRAGARIKSMLNEVDKEENAPAAIDAFMRAWEELMVGGEGEALVAGVRDAGRGALGVLERDRAAFLEAWGRGQETREELARLELDVRTLRALAIAEGVASRTGSEERLSLWGGWAVPPGLIGRLGSRARERAEEVEARLEREERTQAARLLTDFEDDFAEAALIQRLAPTILERARDWTAGAPGVVATLSAPPGRGVWMLEERAALASVSIWWAERERLRREMRAGEVDRVSRTIDELASGVLSRLERAEGA